MGLSGLAGADRNIKTIISLHNCHYLMDMTVRMPTYWPFSNNGNGRMCFHAEFWYLALSGDIISCFPYYRGIRRSVVCKYSHLFSRRLYTRVRNDEKSARQELKLKLHYLTYSKNTYEHILQFVLSFWLVLPTLCLSLLVFLQHNFSPSSDSQEAF